MGSKQKEAHGSPTKMPFLSSRPPGRPGKDLRIGA